MKLGQIDTAYVLKLEHTGLLYKLTLLEGDRLAVMLDGEQLDAELVEAAKPGLRRKLAEQLGLVVTRLRELGVTLD